ncbi:hypothetical protein PV341_44990, partial [Streptomyces sp. PA03-1a]|nr:hypothetical protein [Streptomyces sp. PA03-1a]
MTPATARARTAAVLLLPVLALGSVTGCVSVGGAGGDAHPKGASSGVAGEAGGAGGTWEDGGMAVSYNHLRAHETSLKLV